MKKMYIAYMYKYVLWYLIFKLYLSFMIDIFALLKGEKINCQKS